MRKTIWKEWRTCQWTTGFVGESESEEHVSPVLVIPERRDKMTWAMLVPRRGTAFPWIAKRAARFIDQLGHNRVTLRCDNDPAVGKGNRASTPRRKPGCSREAASGRKPVQARTPNAALELRIGVNVPPHARILCWLVELAAFLMNRCDIGSDGKTPPLRLHGRMENKPILHACQTSKMRKVAPVIIFGLFVAC